MEVKCERHWKLVLDFDIEMTVDYKGLIASDYIYLFPEMFISKILLLFKLVSKILVQTECFQNVDVLRCKFW